MLWRPLTILTTKQVSKSDYKWLTSADQCVCSQAGGLWTEEGLAGWGGLAEPPDLPHCGPALIRSKPSCSRHRGLPSPHSAYFIKQCFAQISMRRRTLWQAAKPSSLPPAPERPRGKVSMHSYSFQVSFWREDLSVILYIFSTPCQWFFSGSTASGVAPPPNHHNENFIENLSRLRKATFFFSPESYAGCFLPHATVRNTVTVNPRRQKRGVKIGTWKRRGKLEKSRESSSLIGKKNNIAFFTNERIRPASILKPKLQPTGIRGFLVPSSGQRWSLFFIALGFFFPSLSDSQSLLCTCRPSYYIMNFDKPISQPGSQEEDVFLTWWLHNEE